VNKAFLEASWQIVFGGVLSVLADGCGLNDIAYRLIYNFVAWGLEQGASAEALRDYVMQQLSVAPLPTRLAAECIVGMADACDGKPPRPIEQEVHSNG
jgi:hypothetical protein